MSERIAVVNILNFGIEPVEVPESAVAAHYLVERDEAPDRMHLNLPPHKILSPEGLKKYPCHCTQCTSQANKHTGETQNAKQ
jgi:hypothetical protein